MLKIRRAYIGYHVTSSPRNVDIQVRNKKELCQVVNHYFRPEACGTVCPLCKQIAAKLARELKPRRKSRAFRDGEID